MWSVARTGGDPAPAFKNDVQLLASAFSRDGKRLAVLRVIKNPAGQGSMYGLFLSDPPGAEPVRFEPFPLLNLIMPTRLAWAANSTELLVVSAGPARIHRVSLRDQSVREFPVEDCRLASDGGYLDPGWAAPAAGGVQGLLGRR